MTAEGRSPRRMPDPGIWILLALPPLLAAMNSAWLYYSPSSIDPWVYFGYFLHLGPFKAKLFPELYYGSRLPWILPGYFAHRMFDVTTAKFVLHFSYYYLAVFSLYFLLKRAVGGRNALLGAVVFGAHSCFLWAIGWDYVDGAGLTYNLLGLACMARAVSAPRPWPWLLLGGVAGGAMFYTHLFLIAYVPFLLAFYLFLEFKATGNQNWRAFFGLILWFGAGALILTVLLADINYILDRTLWFYAPSLSTFRSLSSGPNPWRTTGFDWLLRAFWLGVPAMTAIGGVLYVALGIRRRLLRWGDYKTFFVLMFLLQFTGMIVGYGLGGGGLQWGYYVSYLLPSMFLAIGCMLAVPMERWTAWTYWLSVLGVAAAFAISIRICNGALAHSLQHAGIAAIVIVGTIGLTIKVAMRQRWQALLVALCGLWLYQVGFAGIPGPAPGRHEAFLRIVDSVQAVWSHMPDRPVLFWYDFQEPAGPEFNAVNSTYLWGYTYIGTGFPAIARREYLQPGRTGVILSARSGVMEQANHALQDLDLKANSFEEDSIHRGGVSYHLTFFRLEADTPNLRKLALHYEKGAENLAPARPGEPPELSRQKWILAQYPGTAARMEIRSDGVLAITAAQRWAYGSTYGPLLASQTGIYRFTLKYKVLEGSVDFGGMSADKKRALGYVNLGPPTGKTQTVAYSVPLKAGEGVVLLIANDPPGRDRASTYLIESLEGDVQLDSAGTLPLFRAPLTSSK